MNASSLILKSDMLTLKKFNNGNTDLETIIYEDKGKRIKLKWGDEEYLPEQKDEAHLINSDNLSKQLPDFMKPGNK